MAKLKNKTTLYAIIRKDNDRKSEAICCFTRTLDGAERLCDEYTQAFSDSGGSEDEAYFYIVSNIYYDE